MSELPQSCLTVVSESSQSQLRAIPVPSHSHQRAVIESFVSDSSSSCLSLQNCLSVIEESSQNNFVPVPSQNIFKAVIKSFVSDSSTSCLPQSCLKTVSKQSQSYLSLQNCLRVIKDWSQNNFINFLSISIFSGRLISRSNVYNSLYFVSLRVQRVLKGSVPRRMHRHMRLLFHHTDSKLHPSRDTSRDPKFHTSSYGDTPSHQRRRPNNHNSRGHGGTAAAAAAQSANTASTGAQRSI